MAAERVVRRRVELSDALAVPTDAPQSTTVPKEFLSDATVARNRQKPRSRELMDALAAIDSAPNALASQQIMEWVSSQYEERGGGQIIGLFSRCYLGPPYVDHILTVAGYICEHFRPEDAVPGAYGQARALAANPAYEFVEIYADGALVPVRSDGRAL